MFGTLLFQEVRVGLCRLIFQTIRNSPNAFGARVWSQYGRLYLRHFNELDHEFTARYEIVMRIMEVHDQGQWTLDPKA